MPTSPGNVLSSVATTVLPASLYTAFTEVLTYDAMLLTYKNGESERNILVSAPRRLWRYTKRLKPSQHATLVAFFRARFGGLQAFYFYNILETVPRFTTDPTGVATVGRVKARFVSPHYEFTMDSPVRGNVPLEMIECA